MLFATNLSFKDGVLMEQLLIFVIVTLTDIFKGKNYCIFFKDVVCDNGRL